MWQAFVIDVDGVMTTGRFVYTADGKVAKEFGSDDHAALRVLRDLIDIHFVTGDRRGWNIAEKRIHKHMGFPLSLVAGGDARLKWIAERWNPECVIYMGDEASDVVVFNGAGYSICPVNGFFLACEAADYVTRHSGGDRAVAEACFHVMSELL